MRQNLNILLSMVVATTMALSCDKDSTTDVVVDQPSATTSDVSFTSSILTRATDTEFEAGDVISVTAYSGSSSKASDVSYTFNGSTFNATSTPISITEDEALSYLAIYPYANLSSGSLSFTVQSDQTTSTGYTKSDLMASTVGASSSTQPKLIFDHLMTKVVLNITSDVEVSMATMSAKGSVVYTTSSNSVTANTSSSNMNIFMKEVTPNSGYTDSYEAIIAPQSVTGVTIEITSDSMTYVITYDNALEMSSSFVYTATIKIEDDVVTVVDLTYSSDINDWTSGGDMGGDSSSGDGDSDDDVATDRVYMIGSADDLMMIGVDDGYPLNGYYELASDIYITNSNWTPIGGQQYFVATDSYNSDGTTSDTTTDGDNSGGYYETVAFTGTFNGCGYSIYNLTINSTSDYQGLFGYINGATIKNLTLRDPAINSSGTYVGALVGSSGSNTSVIQNCYVEGGKVGGFNSVGGVVGRAGSNTTISYCSNSAMVYGTSTDTDDNTISTYIGGIVGDGDGSGFKAIYCSNSGDVNGGSSVGGIAGSLYGSYSSSVSEGIVACYNTGNIFGSGGSIGGIAGYGGYTSIVACYNTGAVSGTSTAVNYIGGIVGRTYDLYIISCYNNAVVSTGSLIGAIAGFLQTNIYFTGAIISSYYINADTDSTLSGVGMSSGGTNLGSGELVTVGGLGNRIDEMNSAAGGDYYYQITESLAPVLSWQLN